MSDQFFIDPPPRRAMRPTLRTWIKHFIFLAFTLFTATIASNIYPFGRLQALPNFNPQTWLELADMLPLLPFYYLQFAFESVITVLTNAELLIYGLQFSLSLLFILTCHEAGHYIACRLYGVDATLPYFIPMPPMIGPAGTLGAFIKILSPLPSRKAVFDIGVAGPIAGFLALIPVGMIAFSTMSQVDFAPGSQAGDIYFADPLFMGLLASLFGFRLDLAIPNAFYFATWIGLLVTSLNLIPSGQLDGGHAIFAVFGERIHNWTGKIAFGAMVTLSICGIYFYGSPSALLFTILLGFMMRIGHPIPQDETPLDLKRILVAILTLAIFILAFMPFPIQVR